MNECPKTAHKEVVAKETAARNDGSSLQSKPIYLSDVEAAQPLSVVYVRMCQGSQDLIYMFMQPSKYRCVHLVQVSLKSDKQRNAVCMTCYDCYQDCHPWHHTHSPSDNERGQPYPCSY